MSHDQRFKNLIVDYPRDALRFFAAAEAQDIDDTVRFIHGTYLDFRFLYCDLPSLQARDYLASTNLVARLNVINMAYTREEKLDVFHAATEGLASLETDREKQRKYTGFIDAYVQLSDEEQRRYEEDYLSRSANREVIMGFFGNLIERGHQSGLQEGRQEERRTLVCRLLEKRFGPLPAAIQQRLQNATPEELEHWAMRMLEVDSLNAVFQV